jgi:hypothetical protein
MRRVVEGARELWNQPAVVVPREINMHASPERLRAKLAVIREDSLSTRDLRMFGPLSAILVAIPLAIAVVLSASLWFAANSADRFGVDNSFASRWDNVRTR